VEVPLKEVKTGGTVVGSLIVRIGYLGGGVHDAASIHTVLKAQTVTQFVKNGLLGTFHEETRVRGIFVKLWMESVQGNDGTKALNLCQTKDIL
jgi:hypothetical protein